MRGEHVMIFGSVFSIISVILLVFTHIGQLNSSSLPAGIYMVEVNVAAFGNAIATVSNSTAPGLYDSKATDKMGKFLGLRQYYRWGLYDACGYQKDGSGICNGTSFGYGFDPLGAMVGDVPAKYRKQNIDIIPNNPSGFKLDSNDSLTKAAYYMIFVGSIAAAVAFITGVIPRKITFFVAFIASVIATILLAAGAAIWTVVVKRVDAIRPVKVQYGAKLGIYTTMGPGVYLTWVAFACIFISIFPYALSWKTYERGPRLQRRDSLQMGLLPGSKKY